MLTKSQLAALAGKFKINESVILREYIQVLVLERLYSFKESRDILFKGGTCLHLLYGAPRFSEDLDFSVNAPEDVFVEFIQRPFKALAQENGFLFKERKSVSGRTFLLTCKDNPSGADVFVKFDFSFREKITAPRMKFLETSFPVLMTHYVWCLSLEEILAEKIRAIMCRDKGRDYYDLWYILNQSVKLDWELLRQKLDFYKIFLSPDCAELKNKIQQIEPAEFILDIRPFTPVDQREKLGGFLTYIKDYILHKLEEQMK